MDGGYSDKLFFFRIGSLEPVPANSAEISTAALEVALELAVEEEDYEQAALIKKELDCRKQNGGN